MGTCTGVSVEEGVETCRHGQKHAATSRVLPLCMDMRIDVCAGVCVDMCRDMCVDMDTNTPSHIGTCAITIQLWPI